MEKKITRMKNHIVLTSHPDQVSRRFIPIKWGAKDPIERGPVIVRSNEFIRRNSIGSHGGSYTVYRALASAAGKLQEDHKPDLTNTAPAEPIGPFESWYDSKKIVSMDPWGADVSSAFKRYLDAGYDIRPSVAVTKAHIRMPEITDAIKAGRIKVDGNLVLESCDVVVTKMAVEPVWYLPGIAERFGVDEGELRKVLFQQTGGMFPELVTRHDLKIMLPPIGSTSVYFFGDIKKLGKKDVEVTCRVHDECNGSDVFGSDICTCRPYLVHGIEEAIKTAQKGGIGFVVYYRKEGRALGEVTKFLVYNARKRQEGGDSAATYFQRTECVAGVQDMRFQELMPDILQWMGVTRIDNFISMSDMKYNAIVKSGIEVVNRVEIPDYLVPPDAHVEMEAKRAAGYYTGKTVKAEDELKQVKGRGLDE